MTVHEGSTLGEGLCLPDPLTRVGESEHPRAHTHLHEEHWGLAPAAVNASLMEARWEEAVFWRSGSKQLFSWPHPAASRKSGRFFGEASG